MTTRRPRGRPPKFPPEEVRRRLLDAARERLKVEGVESGLDVVTLDGAILDAEVPRGMAYKIWQDEQRTPQDAFRRATVVDLLSIPATAGLPATRTLTESFLAEHHELLSTADLPTRKRLLRDACRLVGGFNYGELAGSGNWKLYSALRTAAMTRPDVDPAIIAVLVAGENFLIEQYCKLYVEVAAAFRLQLQPGLEFDHFAAAAYALNEGLALRVSQHPKRTGIMLPSPNGDDEEWTLFAIAFEALIDRFFTDID